MTLVVDSSAVVAALVDDGPDGLWARGRLRSADLVDLPVTLHPFRPLAARVWELHPTACALLLPAGP